MSPQLVVAFAFGFLAVLHMIGAARLEPSNRGSACYVVAQLYLAAFMLLMALGTR